MMARRSNYIKSYSTYHWQGLHTTFLFVVAGCVGQKVSGSCIFHLEVADATNETAKKNLLLETARN